MLLRFGERVRQFITEKSSVTGEPTGSLELHGKRERVRKVLNIPEGRWLKKRRGRGKEGKGRLGVS